MLTVKEIMLIISALEMAKIFNIQYTNDINKLINKLNKQEVGKIKTKKENNND